MDDGLNVLAYLILELLSPLVVGVACLFYVAIRTDITGIERITSREQKVIAAIWGVVGIFLLHAASIIWRMYGSNTR